MSKKMVAMYRFVDYITCFLLYSQKIFYAANFIATILLCFPCIDSFLVQEISGLK